MSPFFNTQTLVVQFDNDPIDQSSKLAQILSNNGTDVKFARLRGTHLSPVSASGDKDSDAGWLDRGSKAVTALLLKSLKMDNRRREGGERRRELCQSIARYITDVVSKREVAAESE